MVTNTATDSGGLRCTLVPISLGAVKAFLLKGERSVLIDGGYHRDAGRILKRLSECGVGPRDVSLILLTHSHDDHFGSVRELRERTGARVAVHRLDADALRAGRNKDLIPCGTRGRLASLVASEKPRGHGIEPDITLENDADLQEFGAKGKVVWTPGHTSGSVSVILDNGEAVVGDLIMARFVLCGPPDYPLFAFDVSKLRESIQKVLAFQPTTIHVSHGGPYSRQQVMKRFGSDIPASPTR